MSAARFRDLVEREHARVVDPVRPIPGFEEDNGFYLGGANGCPVVLLGRSSDPSLRQHPFLSEDVVLHEIGHGLIEGSVPPGRSVPPAFQETLADILAHTFLDENCHGREVDPVTGLMICRRDMNRGGSPLARALWRREPHVSGDSVRKVLWETHVESGFERFSAALGKSLTTTFARFAFSVPEYHSRDPFIRMQDELREDFSLHSMLAYEFCSRMSGHSKACVGLQAALGELDGPALARLSANSPTQVGTSGRYVRRDGYSYWVGFDWAEGNSLRMHIRPASGTPGDPLDLVCGSYGSYVPERVGWLGCAGGGVSVHWTSYGAFTWLSKPQS